MGVLNYIPLTEAAPTMFKGGSPDFIFLKVYNSTILIQNWTEAHYTIS